MFWGIAVMALGILLLCAVFLRETRAKLFKLKHGYRHSKRTDRRLFVMLITTGAVFVIGGGILMALSSPEMGFVPRPDN